MVQFHKQPLEFFSKQHCAYSGNFKAKPVYQSSKPVYTNFNRTKQSFSNEQSLSEEQALSHYQRGATQISKQQKTTPNPGT
jgi:hypothetical protein